MTKPRKQEDVPRRQLMDDVLKRMLSSPPKQHKDEKAKPAEKAAQKKPAK